MTATLFWRLCPLEGQLFQSRTLSHQTPFSFPVMRFKDGDYVQTRSRKDFERGTVVRTIGKRIRIKTDYGEDLDFYESELQPARLEKGHFLTPLDLLSPDIQAHARRFEEQHLAGVHHGQIWKGGDTREFLGFCQFLRSVNIS